METGTSGYLYLFSFNYQPEKNQVKTEFFEHNHIYAITNHLLYITSLM